MKEAHQRCNYEDLEPALDECVEVGHHHEVLQWIKVILLVPYWILTILFSKHYYCIIKLLQDSDSGPALPPAAVGSRVGTRRRASRTLYDPASSPPASKRVRHSSAQMTLPTEEDSDSENDSLPIAQLLAAR